MQYFRTIFPKNIYNLLNLSKEVIIAFSIVVTSIFYPNTVEAGIFSSVIGNDALAESIERDVPNIQNMPVLKVTSASSNSITNYPILASGNALIAEVGPSGPISDIGDPINTQISLYVVRSGDTLSQISEMYGVSVNTIVWANNLGKNPIITEGQTLVILPITGIRHIVKKGETIKGIVDKYKANLDEVLLDNDLTLKSTLHEGDTLIIPDAEPSVLVQSSPKTGQVTSRPYNTKGPVYQGYYIRPIVGGRESQGLHGNNAVDLAAPVGTPIYASAGGTIIASMTNGAWNGGYGNYVIISHPNGTQTLYAHTLTNLVTVGQSVDKGDMIAKIGLTGKTTGPHVHFEIRGARNPF